MWITDIITGVNQNKRSQMIKDDYLSSQKEDRWKT